jgi:hypothetical protein
LIAVLAGFGFITSSGITLVVSVNMSLGIKRPSTDCYVPSTLPVPFHLYLSAGMSCPTRSTTQTNMMRQTRTHNRFSSRAPSKTRSRHMTYDMPARPDTPLKTASGPRTPGRRVCQIWAWAAQASTCRSSANTSSQPRRRTSSAPSLVWTR